MATHGKNAKLLGFGYDLTSYFRQVTSRGEAAVADKSVLGDAEHSYDTGMLNGGTISASGLYSDSTGDIQRKLETILGTNGCIMHLPDGYGAVARDFLAVEGSAIKHAINIPHDDMVDVSLEAQGQDGLEIGRTLTNAMTTPISVAGNGTAVDFGDAFAAPSGVVGVVSGCAYLICTAFTGTSVTVTVEDSADGSTSWATVGTFTAVSAANAQQRIPLVAGVLRRYLRITTTGTFSNFTGVVGACKYAD